MSISRITSAVVGFSLTLAVAQDTWRGPTLLCILFGLSIGVAVWRLRHIGASRWWALGGLLTGPYLLLILACIPDKQSRSPEWGILTPWVVGTMAMGLFTILVLGFNLAVLLGVYHPR